MIAFLIGHLNWSLNNYQVFNIYLLFVHSLLFTVN